MEVSSVYGIDSALVQMIRDLGLVSHPSQAGYYSGLVVSTPLRGHSKGRGELEPFIGQCLRVCRAAYCHGMGKVVRLVGSCICATLAETLDRQNWP